MAYLTQYISSFEAALLKKSNHSYHDYIDVDTFVDTLLINEVSKNYDAYRYVRLLLLFVRDILLVLQ